LNEIPLKLAHITGDQAKGLAARDPLIILPLGSLEDQGPHAPIGDFAITERLCDLMATANREAGVLTLVAPVIPFGCDDYCGTSPAGIVLSPETFSRIVGDVLASLVRGRLTKVVLVNGHGGNIPVLQSVTRQLNRDHGIFIPTVNLWRSAHVMLRDIVGEEHHALALGHGADPLTSIALHLCPERVDRAAIRPPETPRTVRGFEMKSFTNIDFEDLDVQVPADYHEVVPSGVFKGHPQLASPEIGARLAQNLVGSISRFMCSFAQG
jgi:creatinine amidohydrolase